MVSSIEEDGLYLNRIYFSDEEIFCMHGTVNRPILFYETACPFQTLAPTHHRICKLVLLGLGTLIEHGCTICQLRMLSATWSTCSRLKQNGERMKRLCMHMHTEAGLTMPEKN
jgi:benzoyl-CoA reductase/2-hydroxyglutaryl-CoA dehydratase subunit BcrC/BadD/HgdB